MRMTGIVAVLLLAVSLFMPGQGRCDELSEAYFPLKEGMRWEYNVTSDQGANQKINHHQSDPPGCAGNQSDAAEMGVRRQRLLSS